MNNKQFLTLVAGYRAGCKNCYKKLYLYLYSTSQIAFKNKNIGNRYTYDDVCEKLMDKIEYLLEFNYNSTVNPIGLVFTSLCNVVLDYHRKNKNNNTSTFTELDSLTVKKSVEFDDSNSYSINWIKGNNYSDDSLLKNEKKELLKNGIKTLTLSQREVMWLLIIEKLPQQEVIERLNLTKQQFYNLSYQGKNKLENYVKRHGY